MFKEFRFAIRMLLKQPGFSLIAALTLALGIGATSAIFSLIQGVLLTPPPYRKPEQLVLIPPVRTDGKKMDSPRGWAAEQWLEWNREAKSFDGIAAYNWTFNFLIRNDGSQSMQGMEVTQNYVQLMGLRPVAGRSFTDADFGPGPVKAIVLGYEFWQRAFGGDRQIIGKTVRISRWDVNPTVIGIMEPGVRFLPSPGTEKEPNYDVNAKVDFWVPGYPDPKYLKEPYWDVVARLRDGNTPQQGQQELAAAVGSVLTLVGIYGVLSLSVASRRRELAIRSAVGAQQKDIRKLIFGEGSRLVAGGVLAGIALAIVVSRVLKSFLFEVQPRDPVTLILVAALFVGVGLLACWVPVRRATKVDPLDALRYE